VSAGAHPWLRLVLAATSVCLLTGCYALAQTISTDERGRKVKIKIVPAYPDLARRMNVGGKVKIEVVIDPQGRVKSSRVIGGHPLLVASCQEALKVWKFFPASEQTTQVVEFDFAHN
jgi:TonB family protein